MASKLRGRPREVPDGPKIPKNRQERPKSRPKAILERPGGRLQEVRKSHRAPARVSMLEKSGLKPASHVARPPVEGPKSGGPPDKENLENGWEIVLGRL